MYIHIETSEYPLSILDIQGRHPNTIFGTPFIPPEGYALVEPTDTPTYEADTQKPVEGEPIEIDGVWRQQWSVVPLSAEELRAAADAKAKAEQEARDAARVRVTKRQALLALFDLKGIKEDAILAAINAIEEEHARYRTLVDWQGAATIENDSPTVLLLADALNITADLPTLFDYAEAL
ncbi:hypothetical protein [uncultured Delftia sp.]|uniref:hypothetical protein n=1 Tax=uncultured Delftia sp. TaxID=191464 RepID=UPI002596BA24|nr:hypothetical protein [uncultured Delftia sp.]